MSGGECDSRTPVYFGCRSSNLILLDLTIALLLRLATVTDAAREPVVESVYSRENLIKS